MTVTQQLCWFSAYDKLKIFSFKFPINRSFCWGTQNYHMYYIQYCFFFTSGRGVDDELVRLLLVEEIIKDANLMCISFSVKHPQTFGESWMSSSNMTRTIANMSYQLTHNWRSKHKLKVIIRNQKIKGTFKRIIS